MSDGDNEQLDSDRAMANLRAKWPIIFESAEVIGELKAKLAATTEELARVTREAEARRIEVAQQNAQSILQLMNERDEAESKCQATQIEAGYAAIQGDLDALTVAARQAEVALQQYIRLTYDPTIESASDAMQKRFEKTKAALAALRAVLPEKGNHYEEDNCQDTDQTLAH